MLQLKILNSLLKYGEEYLVIEEKIPNSETKIDIYHNSNIITKLQISTPNYVIIGRELLLPSSNINLADVKDFAYEAVKSVIHSKTSNAEIKLSREGVVYSFPDSVDITELTPNGIHILSTVLQKAIAPNYIPVSQIPPWIKSIPLFQGVVIDIKDSPKDILKKYHSQITRIETDNGFIEKYHNSLTRLYYENDEKILCYKTLNYICYQDSGGAKEVTFNEKEIENIVNKIIKGYGKYQLLNGTLLI
ncbi:hypothetical protein [Acidianus manzaensis]|uniref:Uncharacterized protein n=1 Tax=Acidianus manzaensis TaxID=282676 RepID=A0A1W6K0Z4_9CREN|nr:hypothetical protein [Acidianus manzaensis]ARM76196.1 hypothetical protein B6F84_09290 [Acidianus manzaensis]